jgi:CTP synthase
MPEKANEGCGAKDSLDETFERSKSEGAKVSKEEQLGKLSAKTDEHEFYTSAPEGYSKGKTKFVVITGSVISGVGKGTFSSCLGTMLKMQYGLNVQPVKFDGYLNYDAGTLNPYRHGEVFVLDDGTECDLDLGTYERMLNQAHTKENYLTAGKVFKNLIDKERAGGYLGRDVQFIPHVTGEIKGFMRNLAAKAKADIVLIECGGTVGDIENSYFIEAMRELAYEEGKENVCFVNVVYILQPHSLGEQKSKAAQLGTKALMGLGIQPDIIICRANNPVGLKIREKLSVYSNVPVNRVVDMCNTDNIHKVPLQLKSFGLDKEIAKILGLKANGTTGDWKRWEELVSKIDSSDKEIKIGITGKYTEVHDAYMSILKALEHTAPYLGAKVKVRWIDTTEVKTSEDARKELEGMDGVIVPGGFGSRGVEGKILCARHARESKMPYLGLCLGFQIAVLEFARNVCGIKGANSTEFDSSTKEPVICILPEQEEIKGLGGTMRLGGHDMVIKEGTIAHRLYGRTKVRERFRHRWNMNTKYIDQLEKAGIIFSGMAPEKRIMQIVEIPGHPFMVGTQFHAEFTSRPLEPNPLFMGFLEACSKRL